MKTYLEVGVDLYCIPLSGLAFPIVSETVKGWYPHQSCSSFTNSSSAPHINSSVYIGT